MRKKTIVRLTTLVMSGIVLVAAAACGQPSSTPTPASQETPTLSQVELDIFSGVPNPTWMLSLAEASDLIDRISRLDQTEGIEQRPGNLGYRGFTVQNTFASSPAVQTIRAYQGLVEVADSTGTTTYLDPQRQIEIWLLATAKPPLEGDLTAEVVQEIMKDVP